MPIYTYKAKKGPTETVEGEIEALSQDDALTKLEGMGLVPISITAKQVTTDDRRRTKDEERIVPPPSSLVHRDETVGFGRIRTSDIDTFTRQLASLIRASVSVLGALGLISQQTENKALRAVVNNLAEQVKDGKLLSEAMEGHRNIFDNLYLNMVRAGEKGGVLDITLTRLADYREKEEEIRRKIQAALAYPVLMMAVGVCTVFIMLTYFLPKLVVLFENMRQALPLPTKILISISKFMSSNWYWILLGGALIVAIFGRVKQGSKKKFIFDMIMLRSPIIRKFVMGAEIAKFTKTLGLLLESGIPIHESLEMATATLDNEVLKGDLNRVSHEIVSEGLTLYDSLKKIDVFPPFALNMIAVGEEGGKLEESLREIYTSYEKELEQGVKIMTALLEPILILVIGAVVGFLVFAMLLPIFNIGIMGR